MGFFKNSARRGGCCELNHARSSSVQDSKGEDPHIVLI